MLHFTDEGKIVRGRDEWSGDYVGTIEIEGDFWRLINCIRPSSEELREIADKLDELNSDHT